MSSRPGSSAEQVAVFVYGTLKPGEVNHQVVADLIVATAVGTLDDHTLLAGADYPGAIPAPGQRVEGHLLVLREPNEALRRLDLLEGHPTLFRRRRVLVRCDAGRPVRAWFYELVQPDGGVWRPCGSVWP